MSDITKLFAYISTESDGEGIIGFFDKTIQAYVPLVGGNIEKMHMYRPKAQEIAKLSGLKITLATFEIRQDIEVIEP